MKRAIQLFMLIILLSSTAFAEKTVEAKLLELMQMLETSRYASGTQPNYQIKNACFYTVYQEWEQRYIDVMKKTPLDDSKITTLNIYSEFAASIRRDMHVLKAYYPNLFSNISHYIQSHRASQSWPLGPKIMTIDEAYIRLLSENLEACYASEISEALSNTVAEADYIAGNRALDDVLKATFIRSEPGIALLIRVNEEIQSDIPGVETGIGQDGFITEIPKQN